jgi:hypothetical protein
MIVPWLSKEKIAGAASELIAGYEMETGMPVIPPIPVENIIEQYLDLDLEFIDFGELHGMKDVFGATFVRERRIAISESLLGESSEGRMIFTCAHETGHWCLHRQYVNVAERSGLKQAAVFCRTENARASVEWQADYFAGCLLMPASKVRETFFQAFGTECLEIFNTVKALDHTVLGVNYCDPNCAENWHVVSDIVRSYGNFTNVSKQAMIIRLQELGLVRNLTNTSLGWGRMRADIQ